MQSLKQSKADLMLLGQQGKLVMAHLVVRITCLIGAHALCRRLLSIIHISQTIAPS